MVDYSIPDPNVKVKYPQWIQDAIDKGNYDYSKSPLKREQIVVNADFNRPQDAKWLQAPDQGPAPSMAQRFQSALPSNPMQQAQPIVAPEIKREPQSFKFSRNRLGLATLLDELEQNEAQAEGRQAKSALVDNPAFVGPTAEQMEGAVRNREASMIDYLQEAAGYKGKGLEYLGDIGNNAMVRQQQAQMLSGSLQNQLAGHISSADSDNNKMKLLLLNALTKQQQAPKIDLRSLRTARDHGEITDSQYNEALAREIQRLDLGE